MRAPKGRQSLSISTSSQRGVVVLALVGELDLATATLLDRAIHEAEEARPKRLVVDLSRLTFIDCAGLAAVLATHERFARSTLPALEIRPGGPQIQRVLRLTRLDWLVSADGLTRGRSRHTP